MNSFLFQPPSIKNKNNRVILFYMINTSSVLEHIAQTTSQPLEIVEKAVTVEYWKDLVSFTSLTGYTLLADYLRNLDIFQIERFGNSDLCARIPKHMIDPNADPTDTFTVYISFPYIRKFKKEFPEFELP